MVTSAARSAGLARATWGLTLLVAPQVLLAACRARDDARARAVLRVLGARQVAQALVAGPAPGRAATILGVAVDLTHAASGLALAAADRGRRRVALVDTAIAVGWALTGRLRLRELSPGPLRAGR